MTSLLAAAASAATLVVAADGGGDFSDLSIALAAAGSGDTLLIGAGSWVGPFDTAGKDLTLSGEGADTRLEGVSGSAVLTVSGGAVMLEGVRVVHEDGVGIDVDQASLTLVDVSFGIEAPGATGGALQADSATLVLDTVTMDDGLAYAGTFASIERSTLEATGLSLDGAEATGFAAGIYARESSITLTDSRFESLLGAGSGAGLFLSGGRLDAVDTTFSGVISENGHGAGVYAENATVTWSGGGITGSYATDYASSPTYGGALCVLYGDLSVSNAELADNQAYYGGAIFGEAGAVTLDGVQTDSNWSYYGGVVYLQTNGELRDTNSVHEENTGYYYGGAYYTYNSVDVVLTGVTSSDNFAYYGGGGLYAYYYGAVRVVDSSFSGGEGYYAGALLLNSLYSTTVISGTSFEDNVAYYYGGAVQAYYSSALEVVDSVFDGNSAGSYYGGALDIYESNASFERVTFTDNEMDEGPGGAVHVHHANPDLYTLDFDGCRFEGNAAGFDGGAVSVENAGELTIRDCDFVANSAGSERYGGALFLTGNHRVTVQSSRFSGNSAGYGGVVYSQDPYRASSTETWTNNTVQESTARVGGVGVYVGGEGTDWTQNTLVGNTCVDEAGVFGVYDTSVSLRNNLVAEVAEGAFVHDFGAGTVDAAYNGFHALDSMSAGTLDDDALATHATEGDPLFAAWTANGNPDDDHFVLLTGSPMIDAGDPELTDPDGSRSDIGAYGGADAPSDDADGDGWLAFQDCHDDDPSAHPGGSETWYDGINGDCEGTSDYDADGDGEDAAAWGGADCDDADASVIECDEPDTGAALDTGDTATGDGGQPNGERPEDDIELVGGSGCGCSGGGFAGFWLFGALGVARRRRGPATR